MPRTKLDPNYGEKLAEQRRKKDIALMNRTIDHAMIDREIPTLAELAGMISMPVSTFFTKRRTGHWTLADLIALRDVLRLTPEQSLNLIGGVR